ncbi:MAG TPA: metal ABC transporter substrate-binding protein [Symbiobacteriaceae bacterium]|jgi:zinc transport system substrate-binding protein|nr:metal ABC transporter substrate-binding protein [Symbiobacteriaceae bacterium]
MRRGLVGIGLLAVLLVLAGCGGTSAGKESQFTGEAGKLKVAASFYPVYEFVKAVGGDHVQVVGMVPAGTEPHDWEPTPQHMRTLNEAQLFVYSGAGMESWVDKTLKSLDNKQLTVVETSKAVELLSGDEHADDGHGHGEALDPHIWLDPQGVVKQVELIRDRLVQFDGAHKAEYEANAAKYIADLKQLDADFQTGLSSCQRRTFFTTHAAFGYLAHRYNLEQHPIMGLTPDAEPKPRDLAKVVDEARQQQVHYIFFEPLVSDRVARTVAEEIGARPLVLNPFEGLTNAEVKAGKSYLTVMRANLTNLKTAMECGK